MHIGFGKAPLTQLNLCETCVYHCPVNRLKASKLFPCWKNNKNNSICVCQPAEWAKMADFDDFAPTPPREKWRRTCKWNAPMVDVLLGYAQKLLSSARQFRPPCRRGDLSHLTAPVAWLHFVWEYLREVLCNVERWMWWWNWPRWSHSPWQFSSSYTGVGSVPAVSHKARRDTKFLPYPPYSQDLSPCSFGLFPLEELSSLDWVETTITTSQNSRLLSINNLATSQHHNSNVHITSLCLSDILAHEV